MAERRIGFNTLVRQFAMISAVTTLLWCLIREISLMDTVFRVGVVYIAIGILGFAASNQLAKLTIPPGESTLPTDSELGNAEGTSNSARSTN